MVLPDTERHLGSLSARDSGLSECRREWFAFRMKPRHEKKAAERLAEKFEIFCPIKEERVRWSDRWKTVTRPWLPGYLFAKVTQRERIAVLNDLSVSSTVCIAGMPAPIRDEEIGRLKVITGASDVEEMEMLPVTPGDHVRIRAGKLMNLNGVVLRVLGKRASLRLESLNMQLVVTLKTTMLEPA